jgi:hypothetical protein
MERELDTVQQRCGHGFVLWILLIALAWCVVELTANPYLAPALAGLKFAWEDIRIAFWLRRVDPVPHRGRAGFWLYLTWAFVKLFLAGLLTTIVLSLVGTVVDFFGGQPGLLAQFAKHEVCIGSVLTWTTGTIVLPIIGLPAFWLARRHDLKPWISSSVDDSRRRAEWPPQGGSANCFPVVALAVFLCVHVAPLAAPVLIAFATDDRDLVFGCFVALTGTYIVIQGLTKVAPSLWSRILAAFTPDSARAPAEFWDDATDEFSR